MADKIQRNVAAFDNIMAEIHEFKYELRAYDVAKEMCEAQRIAIDFSKWVDLSLKRRNCLPTMDKEVYMEAFTLEAMRLGEINKEEVATLIDIADERSTQVYPFISTTLSVITPEEVDLLRKIQKLTYPYDTVLFALREMPLFVAP